MRPFPPAGQHAGRNRDHPADHPGPAYGVGIAPAGPQAAARADGDTLRDRQTYENAQETAWAATWIARVTVVTAPGRLFGSRSGPSFAESTLARGGHVFVAPALHAAGSPCNDHEVLNGSARACLLPCHTAGLHRGEGEVGDAAGLFTA